ISLDSLKMWYSNPRNIALIGLEALNSPSADYGIAFDPQGNTYFSSDRGAVSSSGRKSIRIDGANKFDTKRNESTGRDFIKIYREDGKNQPVAVNSMVPKTYHFADPFFMKEKQVVFYSLTRDLGKVKKNRNYTINSEIYFSSVNESGDLENYQPFPHNSALEHGVITPFVDEQEKKIYFASNREGGLGGYDLYFVTYDEDFNFGSPVNLGPSVNTAGDERDPFLFDGTFYFASNGHVGLGGLDLFQAQFSSGNFTGVKNLGLPYNSPQDDFAFHKKQDGEIYLSSNRANGKGLDDIYRIEDLYRQFVAKVVDCEGNPVSDGLQVALSQKDNSLAIETNQEAGGILKADLAPEADFQLTLNKTGYFSINDNELTTRGLVSDQLEKEYVMKRIPYNSVVFEDLIYYNFDDSTIRSDAEPVMKKLAEILKQFTFLEILIRSHTDSWASDEYNEALSQKRANAVRDFLGDYGIARSRVKSEWFGEKQLVNDCGDGVPCPASEHQLNRRSELILVAFPDDSKSYEFPKELEGIDPELFKDLKLPLDCQ
ncbi:MAG TPA: OmpA family protein, partial [Cyclobacteriaceae bacterium]|nr:OmpA family protein [Cyclobacteriaceae bacterium]